MEIWFVVLLIQCGFAAAGYSLAAQKGRDPVLWCIICLISGILGVIAIAIVPDQQTSVNLDIERLRKPATSGENVSFDKQRWNALIEFDPEISEAVHEVKEIDENYVDYLAEKFMVLNDKTYLPSIISNIRNIVDERKETEAKAASEKLHRITNITKTDEFRKFKNMIEASNVFETNSGVAFVLPDYRCVQVGTTGECLVFEGATERHAAFRNDKRWSFVTDPARKIDYFQRYGDDLATKLSLEAIG